METVSFKVKKEVKEKMKQLAKEIKWADEVRSYIENRIGAMERRRVLDEVRNIARSIEPVPDGTAERLVRAARDSH